VAERLSRFFFLFFLKNAAPELREGKQIKTLARHCRTPDALVSID